MKKCILDGRANMFDEKNCMLNTPINKCLNIPFRGIPHKNIQKTKRENSEERNGRSMVEASFS